MMLGPSVLLERRNAACLFVGKLNVKRRWLTIQRYAIEVNASGKIKVNASGNSTSRGKSASFTDIYLFNMPA